MDWISHYDATRIYH